MIRDRKVIAVVPARGGSTGLPGKNIRPLCGKPLIVWTIEKALRSQCIDTLIVSTDSEEIAAISRAAGAWVPFLRPAKLAGDSTPTISVVEHVLAWCEVQQDLAFDYHVLLEPTSPLREDDDIDAMLTKLDARSDEFDGIVSLGEVGMHPSILKKLAGDAIEPYCPNLSMALRRQDNPPAYFPFGVAYITKVATLLGERSFYPRRCTHHLLQRYQNYEIDDLHDFLAVEAVMRHQWDVT